MAQRGEELPFARLSPTAGRALALAEEKASEWENPRVEDLHILFGLATGGSELTAAVLGELGVVVEDIEAELIRWEDVEYSMSDMRLRPAGPMFTARAMAVLELAGAEADRHGKRKIDAEDLLLALPEIEGGAATFLRERGGRPNRVRKMVTRLTEPSLEPRTSPGDQPPAPPLQTSEGDAAQGQAGDADFTPPDAPESLEAVPTHRDRPATRDELGRARFAEVLGERMRRVRGENTELPADTWRERRRKRRHDADEARHTGPFLVHVYAPWGAGKSSLLNFLAADLRNRVPLTGDRLRRALGFLFGRRKAQKPHLSRWIVVDFNAWEHQRLATPWWWLLAAMQRSCARELWWIGRRRWAWFWIRDIGWRIWNVRVAVLTVVLLAALLALAWALDWLGLTGKSLSAVQAILLTAGSAAALATTLFTVARGTGRWLAIGSAGAADRFLRRAQDPLGVYRQRFRWLARSCERPIAVFIDDLDRCRPEYVVELLEGIQTLFADEPVAYVVAADRDWLCQSFAMAYGDFEKTVGDLARPLGFRFLEKTFQISMELPAISDEHQGTFWQGLLGGSPDGDGAALAGPAPSPPTDAFAYDSTQDEIERRAERLLEEGRDREEVYAGAVRRFNTGAIERQTEMLLSKFTPLLERNPRSMKRLLNTYGFERDLLVREGHFLDEEERKQLALLTILRLRWPLLADHLHANPADAELCCADSTLADGHEFAELFGDPELRRLFQGETVGVSLDRSLIEAFPKPTTAGA